MLIVTLTEVLTISLIYDMQQIELTLNITQKGTASKPNRRVTSGSVRFRPVSIVLNNDNRPEPDGTAGQPRVGFWSRP